MLLALGPVDPNLDAFHRHQPVADHGVEGGENPFDLVCGVDAFDNDPLLVLQPRPELVAPLPSILQFHASLFFVFLVVFPFSRLVHIITFPLRYPTRPFQLVKWVRLDRPVSNEREPVGAGRA